jgi:hypothetical protein
MAKDTPIINYFLVCEYASLSEVDKVNIMGIFDKLLAQSVPVTHIQLFVVANISVYKAKEYDVKINLVKDGSNVPAIKSIHYKTEIRKNGNTIENVGVLGRFTNIVFPEFGKYNFELYIDDVIVQKQSITVVASLD